jgi:hypothetical protein
MTTLQTILVVTLPVIGQLIIMWALWPIADRS